MQSLSKATPESAVLSWKFGEISLMDSHLSSAENFNPVEFLQKEILLFFGDSGHRAEDGTAGWEKHTKFQWKKII